MKNSREPGLRVLIVDDQAVDIATLNFLALNLGFSVELAFDGEDAWQLVRKNKYDLIILDWHMQQMPGWTFLKQLDIHLKKDLRSQGHNRNVIIHTGELMAAEDFCDETQFKILDVWQKPLSPVDLMKRMKRVREQIGA